VNKRKVCVVLVDRANYGRLQPVMESVRARPELELQVLVAGTMVLERFGQPMDVVVQDGFTLDGAIHIELEGSKPVTMAKSVGFGVVEFASEFRRLQPDVVLLIGDRYEALSAAIAAAYMNITLFHIQGGEVSGSIDESARHAISKFAQYHFPSTERSRDFLVRMGERPDTVMGVGCPSSDLARRMDPALPTEVINGRGSGAEIDVDEPFLLVVFHPTTTRFGAERSEMESLLEALDRLEMPTAMLWPNIDAGSDHISKAIRTFRAVRGAKWLRTLTNLTPGDYLKVLARAACALGNSSSFVRDAGYFGTPVVIIGNRQDAREADEHVTRVSADADTIHEVATSQLAHGRYAPSTLYGDGHVADRIAAALVDLEPYAQKTLAYVDPDA
jgi:UDP-hydrolysing UDP-N-acetyl-D-glucosamine 2-epimerase